MKAEQTGRKNGARGKCMVGAIGGNWQTKMMNELLGYEKGGTNNESTKERRGMFQKHDL